MYSAAAVTAALCSVAVAASTAGVAVHDPGGFGPHATNGLPYLVGTTADAELVVAD